MSEVILKNIYLTYPIYGHKLSIRSKITGVVGGGINTDKKKISC